MTRWTRTIGRIAGTRTPPKRTVRGYDAAALKRYRIASGMTQEQFAAKVGLARPNYSNFERGVRTPGVELLARFADELGVDQRDLVRVAPDTLTLLDLRQLAGKTRTEAAAALGFKSVTSYANLETGRAAQTDEQAQVLADLYNVSIDELADAAKRATHTRT